MPRVQASLEKSRVAVELEYDERLITAIKRVPGHSWVGSRRLWTLPKDVEVLRRFKQEFGSMIAWDPALRRWARTQVSDERYFRKLGAQADAELPVIERDNPSLAAWYRPHQRAAVRFMAETNAILADEGGLGKTSQAVGAIMEAGLMDGPQLIVGTSAGLRDAWWEFLVERQHLPVILADDKRDAALAQADQMLHDGEPFWLLINPENLRNAEVAAWAANIEWNSVIVDEFHKFGMNNEKTLFYEAIKSIHGKRKIAISGTPYSGRPTKLFNALQWIDPERFTSRWTWIELWLQIDDGIFGKNIGGIKPILEERFWKHLSRYMVRHLFREVYPEYPETLAVEVKCTMTARQRQQYDKFERDSELFVAGRNKIADNILEHYGQLGRLAFSACSLSDGGKFKPTRDSGKLRQLEDKLRDQGIFEPELNTKTIVASQSRATVGLVRDWLTEKGVEVDCVVGGMKKPAVKEAINKFQRGSTRVMLLTTRKGGLSITLDASDTIHILDETWDPENEQQLSWRIRRLSRVHSTIVYYYRSRFSVDEYIHMVSDGKAVSTSNIIDVHRRISDARQIKLATRAPA